MSQQETILNFKFLILNLISCLVVTSCAIRIQPSGGLKDLVPPKILHSTPENYSTNFAAKQIRIDFDEYIDLKDLNKQLVISPLMKTDPEVIVKSKSLIIKLPDSLKLNTTYTLNFGNAIVDTHEGNAFGDFQYVFSTGPVLDSLQVHGELKFAINLKTEKGIVVMLYNNTSDTVVYNTLPDYFAKTDSAGNFRIKNLRAGNYKIFALKDANANYKFDSKAEAIGFLTQTVNVPDSTAYNFRLFIEPDTLPHVLKSQYVSPGKALIYFTAPVKDFQLNLLPPVAIDLKNILVEKSVTTDTVFVYCTDTLADSLHAVILNGTTVVDTIHVNLKPLSASKGRGGAVISSLAINVNLSADVLEMPTRLMLSFSAPIKTLDVSLLKLTKDSINNIPFTVESTDSLKKNYHIKFKSEENKSYHLLIPSNAVTDIFNQHNDTINIAFRTREEREYANVILNFTTTVDSYNYLVQLLTESDAVVKEMTITKNQKITFDYVLPGKYKIRMIDDANKNGKWDSGNYWRKTQPENVFYYPEAISTRSNWDVDLNWILK